MIDHTHPGYVSRVIDGDTVEVVLDLDFHIRVTHRIRLQGLHAPELNTVHGKEARVVLSTLVVGVDWGAVTTEKDPSSFGRYVGRIAWDGDDLATRLIALRPDLFSAVKAEGYGR